MSSSIHIDKSERNKIYDGIDYISGYGQLITDKEGRILKLIFRDQLNKIGDQFENIFKVLCNKKIAFNKKIHCSIKTVTSAIKKFSKLNIIEVTTDQCKGNVRHLKLKFDNLKASLPTFEETEQKVDNEIKKSDTLTPVQKKYQKAKEGIYQDNVLRYQSKKSIDFPAELLKKYNLESGIKLAQNQHLLKFYYEINITNYCTSKIDYSDLKISSEELKNDKLATFIQNTWVRSLDNIFNIWKKEIENYPKIAKEELLHEILRRAIETGGRVEALPTKAKTV